MLKNPVEIYVLIDFRKDTVAFTIPEAVSERLCIHRHRDKSDKNKKKHRIPAIHTDHMRTPSHYCIGIITHFLTKKIGKAIVT
ncbi:hypothetical protein L21SP2_2821 [Salinispira pacifica]|uniref:Uncharacterized protein n=1 Tax=Salinispira pacifica TaxID=1307761 RepID=V5WM45_9SPIO|nr:hypothetical protein L21SP2_2821 [Salinispira pacifica]